MRVKLTDAVVKSLSLGSKTDAFYWDTELRGFGLRLRRLKDGTTQRTWAVQYRVGGGRSRRSYIGQPGSAAILSAKAARDEAKRLLAGIALGGDPQAEREERRAKDRRSFASVAAEYLAARAEGDDALRPRSLTAVRAYLTGPAYFRVLHGMPLDKITRGDISTGIASIKRRNGPVAAARARSTLQSFFVWAMEMGLTDANPVIGALKVREAAPRERVLSDAELAAIWRAAGDDHSGAVIKLLILTAARRNEVGGMAWSELDREAGTWTLPAARSKNHREHTLPLPPLAWDIIDAVPQRAGRDQLFGTRGKAGLNGWADVKRALDARLGDSVAPWTLHDIRRTVATVMAEGDEEDEQDRDGKDDGAIEDGGADRPRLGIQPHVIEALLNHQSGHKAGVAGTYNRATYRREVRAALALWADYICSLVEGGERKVISLPVAS
jgi:integrase